MRVLLLLLATALAALPAEPSTAIGAGDVTMFECELNGLNNVPPDFDVTATGLGTFVLNADSTELTYTITYENLSSPEFAAHIHNAAPRQEGPIVYDLPVGSPKQGVWEIPPEFVTELIERRLYVNIHTDNYFTGEIRGNIRMVEVPTRPTSIGRLKALYR